MKCGRKTYNAIAVAGLLGGAAAYGDIAQSGSVPVARALPNAPNGYAPDEVDCPSTRPSVRSAATLSPSEISWLENRRSKAADALIDFFGHVAVGSFDAAGYIRDHRDDVSSLPNIGIAVSGGGYRALMNGGGAIKAFDSRTEGSTAEGHLGGLLQSATYLSALSGGGWLVGSLYMNNYTTVSGLQYDEYGSVWEFQESITGPPPEEGRISFISRVIDSVEYWREVANDVDSKRDAGYPVSITDYWGRALSYQLINDTRGGVDYTWSSIALDNGFTEGDMPMPILVADGRNPGEQMISTNATVFEFNPFELGTFDPTVFGFIPTEFLGSAFRGGELPENASCVRGYDNAGFFMGTSSSLFNQFALNLEVANLPDFVEEPIAEILENIGDSNNDIAEYRPNPFFQYSPDSSPFANQQFLPLVDGGEDLQNIPLHPLIQPERHVDVIFAIDSSADNELRWPNGTSMDASYRRSLNVSGIANNTAFPAIPDVNTFVNLGLNNRPTFFGCDSANMTGPSPIIVYIPNAPYSTWSNVSTFQMTYEQSERDAIIENGYNVATMLNGTRDENWTACVGCAILSRSFERTGTTVPDICTQCFEDYCWDGSLNSTTPNTYGPSQLIMDEDHTSAASGRFAISIFAIFATATATLMASYNI